VSDFNKIWNISKHFLKNSQWKCNKYISTVLEFLHVDRQAERRHNKINNSFVIFIVNALKVRYNSILTLSIPTTIWSRIMYKTRLHFNSRREINIVIDLRWIPFCRHYKICDTQHSFVHLNNFFRKQVYFISANRRNKYEMNAGKRHNLGGYINADLWERMCEHVNWAKMAYAGHNGGGMELTLFFIRLRRTVGTLE
jgi:hypothetical protein